MKPAIQLIAMDMDGTLLNPAQQLSSENRLALLEAQQAGIRLAICSGRMPGDSALFALENGLEQIAILGLNGGCCQLSPKAAPYADHLLSEDTALACGQCFAGQGITFGLFMQNRVVVFQGAAEMRRCDWGGHWDEPGAPEMSFGGKVHALAAQGINKIVCVEDDPRILAALRRELEGLKGLQVTSSWVNNLELMPAGVDKGLAVRELAQQLGLEASQVMVIGDYDNDLSMFRYAGFSVAMGNAPANVKAAADRVTLTNAEDGVAYAIRKWALKKL